MSLCVTAGALAATIATGSFTLAWTHSIEKIRWEEDWRIADTRLQLIAARVRGSGAGMEIPDGAVLRDGVWHYRPQGTTLTELQLAHSSNQAPHLLCVGGACRALPDWLPGLSAPATVSLRACADTAR